MSPAPHGVLLHWSEKILPCDSPMFEECCMGTSQISLSTIKSSYVLLKKFFNCPFSFKCLSVTCVHMSLNPSYNWSASYIVDRISLRLLMIHVTVFELFYVDVHIKLILTQESSDESNQHTTICCHWRTCFCALHSKFILCKFHNQ